MSLLSIQKKINNLGESFPLFNVVLHSPNIPGNTGSIGRTCLATNCRLILIHPIGFELTEKAVRRAGLDYWKFVQIDEYNCWDDFLNLEKINLDNSHFFTKTAEQTIYQRDFNLGDYLVFGSETKGLPEKILKKYYNQSASFPMFSSHLRSINLANIVTSAVYYGLGNLVGYGNSSNV